MYFEYYTPKTVSAYSNLDYEYHLYEFKKINVLEHYISFEVYLWQSSNPGPSAEGSQH